MPYTKILLTFLFICLAGTHSPAMSAQDASTSEHPLPSKPKVIFFDVNETTALAVACIHDIRMYLWYVLSCHHENISTVLS